MNRFQAFGACLVLVAGGATMAAGQDGPPLLPPQGTGPATSDPAPRPAPILPEPEGPPLSGPSGMPKEATKPRGSRPVVLESVPTGDLEQPRPLPDPKPKPAKPAESPKTTTGPVRRGRLIERLGALPLTRPRPTERTSDSVSIEPKSDPAADGALRKRIEKQAATAVGDRASEIEVRVVDRSITIRAKVDRFWNRRAVRRSLETLPALNGSKAKVTIEG